MQNYEQAEHREILGQWKYSMWYYDGCVHVCSVAQLCLTFCRYMSLYLWIFVDICGYMLLYLWIFVDICHYICQYLWIYVIIFVQTLREKEMETHSSILAWKTPWAEEAGGLQSMRPQRVRHTDWAAENAYTQDKHNLKLWPFWGVWIYDIKCIHAVLKASPPSYL